MEKLTPHNIMLMLLSLGILLGIARVLGEIAQKLHQPAVVGELFAGILLGPTVLGTFAPNINLFLFPPAGPNAVALDSIANLAIVFFLMVAGIEVDLSTIWKHGQTGLKVGISSVVIPFILGFAIAWFYPNLFRKEADIDLFIFSLFIATAMSISALPIIAKTLMDMNLYRSDIGMIIISAAILNDIVGWIVFAIVLGLMGGVSGAAEHNIIITIASTLIFAGSMLTLGRIFIHKILPFIQAYTKWPGGELSFAIILALFGSAFTEWIGIHAIFGAFLVGAAIGDSSHLRERTRVTISNFISSIFAPLFFATIGLKVNFLKNFDFPLISAVILIASVSKLLGGILGARWGKMSIIDSWIVSFAMNSRGAMEIILGLLALQYGIVNQKLFVALIFMAIITSIISGPAIRIFLNPTKAWKLHDVLFSKLFIRELKSTLRQDVINDMVSLACKEFNLNYSEIQKLVWEREKALSTGIGKGIAIPHARIKGLAYPLAAVGISDNGIDFDSPDGKPANIIFLVLTPDSQPESQLSVIAEIAKLFKNPNILQEVLKTRTFTDFLALIKSCSIV